MNIIELYLSFYFFSMILIKKERFVLKSFSSLKKYYSLANVKRVLLILEFFSFLIPSLLSIITPVLAANVISSLTVYDFSKAVLMLSIDFGIIVLTALLYFFYHLISNKTTKIIVKNMQESVYNNAKQNLLLNKIHSSTLANIWLCAEFNRKFLYKICTLIKSIIILSIIIYFNFVIGLILIGVSFISYSLLRITNSKIQTNDAALTTYNQNSLELFNSIKQGTKEEPNAIIERSLKDKYFDYVDTSIQIKNRISLYYNINNNFISLILKVTVFSITIYLISLIKSTALTLSLYLILTPYLTSSAQNLISFFEIFSEIAIMDNALQEFDSIKFQSPEPKDTNREISTFNISITGLKPNKNSTPLDLYIPHGSVCLIKTLDKETAQDIFNIFSKKQKAFAGNIYVDDQSVFDLSEEQLDRIFSFTLARPYFYNMSLFENLYLVKSDKSAILKGIKSLGLKPLVDSLKDGLNTSPADIKNDSILFLLGLVRSESKIICVLGFPEEFSESSLLQYAIKQIKKSRTVIFIVSKQNPPLSSDIEKNFLGQKEIQKK